MHGSLLRGALNGSTSASPSNLTCGFLWASKMSSTKLPFSQKNSSKGDVKQKIHAAFQRSAQVDAQKVGVDAKEGKVTLHGHVSSWVERESAEKAAWKAPRSIHRANHLIVQPVIVQ